MLEKLAKLLVQPMMRTLAILGVLLSQAMSACGPGTMVVCVHQGGRAHVELVRGACCHKFQHAHSASLDHEHESSPCGGHLTSAPVTSARVTSAPVTSARAITDVCGDESGSCTDYPLVISQLRTGQPRSPLLAANLLPCLAAWTAPAPILSASVDCRLGTSRAEILSPTLAALSTIVLRC